MGRYTKRLADLTPDQTHRLVALLRTVRRVAGPALIAYVVPRAGEAFDAAALLAHARAELPDHMVPTSVIRLDALPLTPSGKIDRPLLAGAGPGEREPPPAASMAPEGPMEEALARVWCSVMERTAIGRHEDFFADLGGHSLLATRLLSAIREHMGIDLPVRGLFEAPSIARLAAAIGARGVDTSSADVSAIEPVRRDAHLVYLAPDEIPESR